MVLVLEILLGTLGDDLFWNVLTGEETIRAAQGTIRGGLDF